MGLSQHSLSPRRPSRLPRRRPSLAYTPPRQSEPQLKNRLEALLEWLQRFGNNDKHDAASDQSLPDDGLLRILQFWRRNSADIDATGAKIQKTGRDIAKGDLQNAKENALGIDLSWLLGNGGSLKNVQLDPDTTVMKRVENTIDFLLDSLTPWDFDRHDFGFTFANVWEDVDTGSDDDLLGPVKMTSTIKPLEKEWKLSARTKILDLGEGGVLFGKAGLYLAGKGTPYIGVEADKVWDIPGLSGTKAFVNVNYRSSRMPDTDPVLSSVGVELDFPLLADVILCLRIGVNPLERKKIVVTPIPNGSYF